MRLYFILIFSYVYDDFSKPKYDSNSQILIYHQKKKVIIFTLKVSKYALNCILVDLYVHVNCMYTNRRRPKKDCVGATGRSKSSHRSQ